MKYIKNVKIQQNAEKLEDIKGAEFRLTNSDDLHIKNMEISQNAKEMKNVTGLSFITEGNQSARIQGVKIEQPGAKIIFSDNPDIKITINKQN